MEPEGSHQFLEYCLSFRLFSCRFLCILKVPFQGSGLGGIICERAPFWTLFGRIIVQKWCATFGEHYLFWAERIPLCACGSVVPLYNSNIYGVQVPRFTFRGMTAIIS